MSSSDPDAEALYGYCAQDVETEHEASSAIPPMTPEERAFWLIDQDINFRGVKIDLDGVRVLHAAVNEHIEACTARYRELTDGLGPTQVAASLAWMNERGADLPNLQETTITEALARDDLDPQVRDALQIRADSSSASVKKLAAMLRTVASDGRIKNLYTHHATRTGRPTGSDVQATNMPRAGPDVRWCGVCGHPSGAHREECAWCGAPELGKVSEWGAPPHAEGDPPRCVDYAIRAARTGGARLLAWVFGDVLLAVAGCLRGLFVADEGYDLISADYEAIEAVVLACLAGEQWRIDAFAAGRSIYLESISQLTGIPYETYVAYAKEHGKHHPDRQDGKTLELACGFRGSVGSMRAFGAEGTDEELKRHVTAWRKASPAIVEFWGGQHRGVPWKPETYRWAPYGLEGAAVLAMLHPDQWFWARQISYRRLGSTLWLRLPSGREIPYHCARLEPSTWREGEFEIVFKGWNTNHKKGKLGWIDMRLNGPATVENVVQAVAHDLLRHGMKTLVDSGTYTRIVLHTYDEIVSEVAEGYGSEEEFTALMADRPAWASDWPIRASGAWRGKRYRK